MTRSSKRTIIFLALIILLAGALRIARALQEERYSVDAYYYFSLAENYAFYGGDYVREYHEENMPPLLPRIQGYAYNLGLTPEQSGLLIGILLGSLMPLAAFWIALNLFPQNSTAGESDSLPKNYLYGLLAAFFVAIHPFFIRISVSCLREILYLPLTAFAVAFAVAAITRRSLLRWCCFALLAAFATTARREGVLIPAVFLAWQTLEAIIAFKDFRSDLKYRLSATVMVTLIYLGTTMLLYGNILAYVGDAYGLTCLSITGKNYLEYFVFSFCLV
ncbi:MAG: hypothetical protein PHV59_00485 [Victivallales bacterium]|nr:hypothetical protein [Victivallales bacterium]